MSDSLQPHESQHSRSPCPSLTRWTWVWVNSGSWWWTGKPGVLQFMGLQSRTQLSLTELNWCDLRPDWFTIFNGSSGSLKYKEQISTRISSLVLIPHRTAVFGFNVFADNDFPYSAEFFFPPAPCSTSKTQSFTRRPNIWWRERFLRPSLPTE